MHPKWTSIGHRWIFLSSFLALLFRLVIGPNEDSRYECIATDSCPCILSSQASEASATDLRLWTSYVQFLNLLDSREESITVAEKALSMVQVINVVWKELRSELTRSRCAYFLILQAVRLTDRNRGLCLGLVSLLDKQALPEGKKSLSAELFWVTFRLHAGLPVGPHDASPLNKNGRLANLFRESPDEAEGNRDMALLVLCSFAEGTFQRPRRNSKV